MTEKRGRAALGRGLRSLISTPLPIEAPNPKEPPNRENLVPFPKGEVQSEKFEPHNETPLTAAPSESLDGARGVRYLAIDDLINNPQQPRQQFSEREISELAESIRALGVIQPVLARPSENQIGKFEIVAGERRWRAARAAGLATLPVLVKELADKETLEIAVVENVQRQDLNPVEEARAYQRLADEFQLSQQEIATRVGKDRASISNYLRLLKLPETVQSLIRDGLLSMGHAKAILTVREPSMQVSLSKKVIDENLSVRQLESIVAREIVLPNNASIGVARTKVASPEVEEGGFGELVERLRRGLGTKVLIKHHTSGRGSIVIQYFSEQELGRIVDTICDK